MYPQFPTESQTVQTQNRLLLGAVCSGYTQFAHTTQPQFLLSLQYILYSSWQARMYN